VCLSHSIPSPRCHDPRFRVSPPHSLSQPPCSQSLPQAPAPTLHPKDKGKNRLSAVARKFLTTRNDPATVTRTTKTSLLPLLRVSHGRTKTHRSPTSRLVAPASIHRRLFDQDVGSVPLLVPAHLDELKLKTRRDAPPSSLSAWVYLVSFLRADGLAHLSGRAECEHLNTPARFLDPYHSRVTFECIAPLEDGAFLALLHTHACTRISIWREELTDSSHKE